MVPRAFRVSAISGVPLGAVQLIDGKVNELDLPPGSYPLLPPMTSCPEGYVALPVQTALNGPVYMACVPKAAMEGMTPQEKNKMLLIGGGVVVALGALAFIISRRRKR